MIKKETKAAEAEASGENQIDRGNSDRKEERGDNSQDGVKMGGMDSVCIVDNLQSYLKEAAQEMKNQGTMQPKKLVFLSMSQSVGDDLVPLHSGHFVAVDGKHYLYEMAKRPNCRRVLYDNDIIEVTLPLVFAKSADVAFFDEHKEKLKSAKEIKSGGEGPVRRKRGRPRKYPKPDEVTDLVVRPSQSKSASNGPETVVEVMLQPVASEVESAAGDVPNLPLLKPVTLAGETFYTTVSDADAPPVMEREVPVTVTSLTPTSNSTTKKQSIVKLVIDQHGKVKQEVVESDDVSESPIIDNDTSTSAASQQPLLRSILLPASQHQSSSDATLLPDQELDTNLLSSELPLLSEMSSNTRKRPATSIDNQVSKVIKLDPVLDESLLPSTVIDEEMVHPNGVANTEQDGSNSQTIEVKLVGDDSLNQKSGVKVTTVSLDNYFKSSNPKGSDVPEYYLSCMKCEPCLEGSPRRCETFAPAQKLPAVRQNPTPPTRKLSKRAKPCGKCPPCLAENCQKCAHCLDMRKYGGPGKMKQKCMKKVCINPRRPDDELDISSSRKPVQKTIDDMFSKISSSFDEELTNVKTAWSDSEPNDILISATASPAPEYKMDRVSPKTIQEEVSRIRKSANCGKCKMCLDKPEFGGSLRLKQMCLVKKQKIKEYLEEVEPVDSASGDEFGGRSSTRKRKMTHKMEESLAQEWNGRL